MKVGDLDLFKGIDAEEIQNMMTCSKAVIKKFPEGSYLFRNQDKPRYLYVILSGRVIITKDFYSGKQDILLVVNEGEILGELFFNKDFNEYWYDAVAKMDTEVLMIPWDFFFGFCGNACKKHQNLIKNMLIIMSERTHDLTEKAHILSCNILREKIAIWLLFKCDKNDNVVLTLNREQLADYLGVTRPSLSRELMKMQDDGLIYVEKNSIKIIDRDGIEELV